MTTPTASSTPVKKTPAKKSAAKSPKPTAKKAAPKQPVANDVFARWKDGARISELVKEFKLTRPQIRRELMKGAGSREAFKALRKQGAGGSIESAKK